MEDLYRSLLELQALDQEIAEAEATLESFEPRLEELDAPVAALEREFSAQRGRLEELRQEQRRLERGAEEKRDRLKRYQERYERVRTSREEEAARIEMDLIRKAAEADEDEAIELSEQVTRLQFKVDELEQRLGAAREELDPRRNELLEGRREAEDALVTLRDRRENHVVRMDDKAARLYERVKGGRTRLVIAGLMPDGACGHCFGLVPLQRQTEIRQGDSLIRCEACGVILHPGE